MTKVKKSVFLHENTRKKSGGFTDMNTEEKIKYHKERRVNYMLRRVMESQALKDKGAVHENNWKLVMGHNF
tara:strand:- start:616 stop:828 length:213 start_codon:yes stop_codon:yes gene_type:complete